MGSAKYSSLLSLVLEGRELFLGLSLGALSSTLSSKLPRLPRRTDILSLMFPSEAKFPLLVVLGRDSVEDRSLELSVDSSSSVPDDSALLDGEGLP